MAKGQNQRTHRVKRVEIKLKAQNIFNEIIAEQN